MEELRIGVVGAGEIGQAHIRRITDKIQSARVVAVADINEDNAKKAAAIAGARIEKDAESLVNSPDVDAVMVCSWGGSHAEHTLLAIKAGKPVFCEKPIATTVEDALKVVNAEIAHGKKLVQVGFMRRYDLGYRQLKGIVESKKLGEPLIIHSAHRNVSSGPGTNTAMVVSDTAIHEIDVLSWMVDEEFATAQVILPRKTRHTTDILNDPQMIILTTKSGIVMDIEVFVNCRYGYDIQCEICFEDGIARMDEPSFPTIRFEAERSVELNTHWKDRFVDAFDVEIQSWVDNTLNGIVDGPTAWDGYVAGVTADALVKAQTTGAIEKIVFEKKPIFYK